MMNEIMAKFNIKPGDLIEWVYKDNNQLVWENQTLYSSIEQRYVPIGSKYVHMCIFYDGETYLWLNEEGFFSAKTNDSTSEHFAYDYMLVAAISRDDI